MSAVIVVMEKVKSVNGGKGNYIDPGESKTIKQNIQSISSSGWTTLFIFLNINTVYVIILGKSTNM